MKRRSFIQSLLAIPVVGAMARIALPSAHEVPLPRNWQMDYKGFALRWSGWIGDVNRPRYCGHWVGVNKETNTLIYASYPGREGEFKRGDAFDIIRVSPQIEITLETSEALKTSAQSECLQRIIRVIDNWRPGLTSSDNHQNYLRDEIHVSIKVDDLETMAKLDDSHDFKRNFAYYKHP